MNFNTILDFWFGNLSGPLDFPAEKSAIWFRKSDQTDQLIRDRFQFLWQKASEGMYQEWAETPRGRLAMIVLFDQFSRNMFRKDARCFSQDEKALKLAREGIESKADRGLYPIERVFFYLPFEHSEKLVDQKLAVRLFKDLADTVPNQMKSPMREFLRYAQAHHDIIERFGRFPHRNIILGRESTPEEVEFLKTPGSSF